MLFDIKESQRVKSSNIITTWWNKTSKIVRWQEQEDYKLLLLVEVKIGIIKVANESGAKIM